MTTTIETREFQAEARQLLDLMIHSVYSNKDIFLRELISNASDALDKRRVASLTNERIAMPVEPEIRIERNPAGRLLTISDNGIGMSRQEVIEYVGTLARSGTKEFLNRLKSTATGTPGSDSEPSARSDSAAQDSARTAPAGAPNISADLIGQFGVGFYSSFLVANRVALTTRRADEETATRWESTGDGTYTLEEVERMEPGTSVTLYLKDADPDNGLEDYTGEWKIKEIVKQYSDFVIYPIRMEIGEKLQTINSMKAIWTRDFDDVKPEEYTEFYHHLSHDWADPLDVFRFKGEGTFEYTMLLFLPERAPFDLFYPEMKRGVHLYVKRVFIMDDCKDLVPDHLRFVRGVVDSEDLSLNISREILQQDRQITLMRKRLERKVLQELEEMKTRWVTHRDAAERSGGDVDTQAASTSESNSDQNAMSESRSDSASTSTVDADSQSSTDIDTKDSASDDKRALAYLTFWRSFGKVLKEGLYRPSEHTERILALCLFASTTPASVALEAGSGSGDTDSDDADLGTGGAAQSERAAVVTLADYVARMKEDQEPIYYLAGEHLSVLRESPHLEAFRAKGYEVLLLTDPVDELWTATPNLEYQGHRFESIAKGTAEIGSNEERRRAAEELSSKRKELDSLLDSIQEHLSGKVKSVRLTNRLTESLACLVGDEGDLSPHMAQMLRAMGQDPGEPKRVLELNPSHPVLAKLRQVFDADAKDPRIAEYAELIHGQAVLSEGGRLADPARFTKLLGKLMAGGFGG